MGSDPCMSLIPIYNPGLIVYYTFFAKRIRLAGLTLGKIPIDEFVRTNYGRVIEPQGEMLREKVRTVGIGLIDRIPGPFELCIDRIWVRHP